jgi:hypothetical protein
MEAEYTACDDLRNTKWDCRRNAFCLVQGDSKYSSCMGSEARTWTAGHVPLVSIRQPCIRKSVIETVSCGLHQGLCRGARKDQSITCNEVSGCAWLMLLSVHIHPKKRKKPVLLCQHTKVPGTKAAHPFSFGQAWRRPSPIDASSCLYSCPRGLVQTLRDVFRASPSRQITLVRRRLCAARMELASQV